MDPSDDHPEMIDTTLRLGTGVIKNSGHQQQQYKKGDTPVSVSVFGYDLAAKDFSSFSILPTWKVLKDVVADVKKIKNLDNKTVIDPFDHQESNVEPTTTRAADQQHPQVSTSLSDPEIADAERMIVLELYGYAGKTHHFEAADKKSSGGLRSPAAKGEQGGANCKTSSVVSEAECLYKPNILKHNRYSPPCSCIHMVKPLNTYAPDDTEQRASSTVEPNNIASTSRASKKRKSKSEKQTGEKKRILYEGPEVPPGLPEDFKVDIQRLGATTDQPVLVIQKALRVSDLKPDQGRLSMPLKQVAKFLAGHESGFLTEEEKAGLEEKVGDGAEKKKNAGMDLDLIDTKHNTDKITLKKWDMKKPNNKNSPIYVLTSKAWNELVKCNGLRTGNIVQVWSFRVGLELKLALVMVDKVSVDDPDYKQKYSSQKKSKNGKSRRRKI